jgi:hypothetical protein
MNSGSGHCRGQTERNSYCRQIQTAPVTVCHPLLTGESPTIQVRCLGDSSASMRYHDEIRIFSRLIANAVV